MFDILDSNLDLGNLGGLSNSRSSSMKKINKKQSAHTPKQSLRLDQTSKFDFDNILDGLATKQSKFFKQNGSNPAQISNQNHNQMHDYHFQRSSQSRDISSRTNLNFQKDRYSFKNEAEHNQSSIEIHGINQQFGRTQHTIANPSVIGQSFVSSRQMKPPIKRKESTPYIQSFNFGSSIGNTIPQQDPTIANSSQQNEELRASSRSHRKRSSIDSRSEINEDIFPLAKAQNRSSGSQIFHLDSVKEDSFLGIHKSQSCVLQQNQKKKDHNDYFLAKDKLQQKSQNLKTIESTNKTVQPLKSQQKPIQSKVIVQEYEKQIELLKNSYKNQIQHLQQCLNKQIAENKSMRETFMIQTTKLIEDQRSRNNRIHDQQINRLKDLFIWQKKRLEETYKRQIQSLKSSFDFANKTSDFFKAKQGPNKQSLQFLEYQLKSKEQMVQNKLRNIQLREMQLQTKQNEFTYRRKRQEDRFRQEQKRLMEMQLQLKKQTLQNKKSISHEKQQLATQLGTLQAEYYKKNEQLEILKRELEMQRSIVQEEKIDLRRINAQIMSKHKIDLQEIQRQKQRLKELQIELVRKIRVVEMKAKELSYQCNNHEDISSVRKQANWVQEHQIFSKIPSQSIEKKLNTAKSMSNINRTKERFYALQHNSKSKLNISVKQNKKIDLSGYMTRIENQTKNTWQA